MNNSLSRAAYARLSAGMQDLVISAYGARLMVQRHGGSYRRWKAFYADSESWSLERLQEYQLERLRELLTHAKERSPFYARRMAGFEPGALRSIDDIRALDVVTKDDLRRQLEEVKTIRRGIPAQTGGTTGTPLKVLFTPEDVQERQAWLSNWREGFGAFLRRRRATFTGRIILPEPGGVNGRFWRNNLLLNQRIYSSFHLEERFLGEYVEDLNRFQPEWIDGFPSSITAVARFVRTSGLELRWRPRVIFTTAETLHEHQRELISTTFNCPVVNQYASSEGAPMIFECQRGRLHMDLRTGVIEPGETIRVTSFTTHGVPLIRYDIGDVVDFTSDPCDCGNANPTVRSVAGREQDFVISPARGHVTMLGGIFKSIPPVVKSSQIVQTSPEALTLRLVPEEARYRDEHGAMLTAALRDRVGEMQITIQLVDRIDRESNGKLRFVKRIF